MLNFETLKRRAILTETLPYEVPALFSNEFLFSSELSSGNLSDKLKKIIYDSPYRRPLKTDAYTIPMSFQIRKGQSSRNTLGVIHPLQQLNIADFIDDYWSTIVEECKSSPASLRSPAEVVPFLTKTQLQHFSNNQDEFEQNAPADGLSGVPYSASYFSLRKYNLLDKFYSSNELLRLETRFRLLRTVDVTKCFFNIYTHSVTWAVKEKSFSKSNTSKYSFESRFDELMQKSNYNETNGIVVGPEISRIFAEVILQRIDQNIIDRVRDKWELKWEEDYTFRRYVDDYFIFARDEDVLDRITRAVHDCLEEYKLFPNSAKQEDFKRPFITNITLAKRGIVEVSAKLEALCTQILLKNSELLENNAERKENDKHLRDTARRFREILEDIRVIIGKTDSNFSQVSGPIYTAIANSIAALRKVVSDESEQNSSDISIRLRGIVRILFYCIASDFRVTPLFKCHQALEAIRRIISKCGITEKKVIDSLLIFELTELFDTYCIDETSDHIPIEICNLFVIASTIDSDLFLQQTSVKMFVGSALEKTNFSYFSFVSLIFLLKDAKGFYEDIKSHITDCVRKFLIANKQDLRIKSEIYLLFSDFVSCPYISLRERANVLNSVIGSKNITVDEVDVDTLSPHFAFVDWSGSKASYILHRKRLQPVYFA